MVPFLSFLFGLEIWAQLDKMHNTVLPASENNFDNACLVFSFGFVAAYLFGLD